MASEYEQFWEHTSYAVVGHSANKPFPKLTYAGLKKSGKRVFAVDPSAERIDDDEVFADLKSLPDKVDAVVLEVPPAETEAWVGKVAEAGIDNVWVHMGTDTPEAVALAKEKGLRLVKGTCAVMYVTPGPSFHSIHKWINKLRGKY